MPTTDAIPSASSQSLDSPRIDTLSASMRQLDESVRVYQRTRTEILRFREMHSAIGRYLEQFTEWERQREQLNRILAPVRAMERLKEQSQSAVQIAVRRAGTMPHPRLSNAAQADTEEEPQRTISYGQYL